MGAEIVVHVAGEVTGIVHVTGKVAGIVDETRVAVPEKITIGYHANDIPTDGDPTRFNRFRDRIGGQSSAHEPIQGIPERKEECLREISFEILH
jgi:hypothetical protein